MSDVYRAPEKAMAAALTRFYAEFPQIDGIALDTIRNFAHKQFTTASTLDRILNPRYPAEAPEYAYQLLLKESLLLARGLTQPNMCNGCGRTLTSETAQTDHPTGETVCATCRWDREDFRADRAINRAIQKRCRA